MKTGYKVFIGILLFLPLLGIALYFYWFFEYFFGLIENAEHHQNNPEDVALVFKGMVMPIMAIIVSSFISLGLMIYFIIHAVQKSAGDSNRTLIWVLLLVLISYPAMIFYYIAEIVMEKDLFKSQSVRVE